VYFLILVMCMWISARSVSLICVGKVGLNSKNPGVLTERWWWVGSKVQGLSGRDCVDENSF
jgi:hypothetical protein